MNWIFIAPTSYRGGAFIIIIYFIIIYLLLSFTVLPPVTIPNKKQNLTPGLKWALKALGSESLFKSIGMIIPIQKYWDDNPYSKVLG